MGTPDIDSEATTHAADSVTRQARHQRDRERIPESQATHQTIGTHFVKAHFYHKHLTLKREFISRMCVPQEP